jgi:hypothetical protein
MPRFARLRLAGRRKVTLLVPLTGLHPGLPHGRPDSAARVERRALAIWPRLDHRALHRCGGNVPRIAAHIAHRTKMTPKAIETLIDDK